jgi:hypothetical protein
VHTHKIYLIVTFTTSALVMRFSTIDHVGNLDPISIIEIKKSNMDQVYGSDDSIHLNYCWPQCIL